MSDWLIGWTNWLRTLVYPMPIKRRVCARRGHNDYQIDQTMWCLRCARHEDVDPEHFVVIGCASCPTEIKVPYTFDVSEPDDEGHQYLNFEPDMADLWAHSWTHSEDDE